jgi:Spy/CpxP family protein refolding chaperone
LRKKSTAANRFQGHIAFPRRTKMKLSNFCYVCVSLLSVPALAQSQPQTAPAQNQVFVREGGGKVMIHSEMGKWWKDSNIAKKLQLTEGQITQLDQTFFDHKMKLVDYGAEMEKEDLKLQNLLDADVPNEGQVGTQVDQVLTARGKLEREYTMMNLDLRKVLYVEQWRQLKSIREQRGGPGEHFLYRRSLTPGGPPPAPGADLMPLPLPRRLPDE